ncbi:MAG: hypothetical protein RDU76_00360 [Candidatus Edwardsbacteria bacterium]|nr:hypothetical protein [Candidatus Edwardsbacteria bacterium]
MASSGNQAQKYKCPCGKSYYTVHSYYDQAGLFDEHWEMNCCRCKQRYQLSSLLKESGRGLNEAYLWAPINIFSELAIVEDQLHRAQGDMLALARELYLERWLGYFSGAKTRKDVWRRLTDGGKRAPSYRLFVRSAPRDNLEDYLQRYFHYFNVDHILEKLGVRDIRLDEMKGRIAELQTGRERAQGLLRMEGFAGRSEYRWGSSIKTDRRV